MFQAVEDVSRGTLHISEKQYELSALNEESKALEVSVEFWFYVFGVIAFS